MDVIQSMDALELKDEDLLNFAVNWGGLLEPIEMPAGCCVADLADYCESAAEVPPEHKLFIFKGLLLHPAAKLSAGGVRDGSVLHMVLNDDPYVGKPLHIKSTSGQVRTVYCGADFYVEDVKEELSYFVGEEPPEKTKLIFAGRELQNQHTLREYNIQKPSVVIAISSGSSARDIACFVKSTEPPPDCNEVSTKAKIFCNFNSTEENETHFWGQMLGGPDFNSISSSEFSLVANLGTELPVPGRVSCDPNRHTVVFAPSQQLKPATRYSATINPLSTLGDGRGNIEHSRAKEKMFGELKWDFFTSGYSPLRVTGVYPRPHSRVTTDTVCIIVSFSAPLHASYEPEEWITVRGHELNRPIIDHPTNSLVYTFKNPVSANEICRVRIREQIVRGSRGESLFPPQKDGLIKTSTFRWKFYTAETSMYEEMNLETSGVAAIIDRVVTQKGDKRAGRRALGPPKPPEVVGSQGSYSDEMRVLPPTPRRGDLVVDRYEGYDQEDREEGAAQGLADWFNPGNIIGQLTQDAGQGGGAADASTAGKPHDSWRF